ncbi:AhpD-like protein [Halteromyces radiatus]|uniref:AhpD-like protein n=1 Tax=Halteromyces radiatus TaxID=101107 RepID=UPI00221E4682|nr:AhpD-like protein [Halteromyces radiatus]KAI8099341.1 AhpD-like protein [Halteromyces radiatus]
MSLADAFTKLRTIYKLRQHDSTEYLSNNWFIIAAVVISTLNHPEDIQQLYALINLDIDTMETLSSDEKLNLKTKVVAKLRDAILKGFIAGGFPKTINGLQQLHKATPEAILDRLPKQPIRQEDTWEKVTAQRQRGKKLFDTIYDRHTDRVMNMMATSYPDLAQTAHYHLYGSVLSDTTTVSAKETSLIVVAGCFAQNLPSQLRGHAYGAVHNGASQQDLQQVYESVVVLCRHYGTPVPLIPPPIESKL